MGGGVGLCGGWVMWGGQWCGVGWWGGLSKVR